MKKSIMCRSRHYAATLLLSFAAALSLGCDDPSGPGTGRLEVTVSTAGVNIDLDPNGYALSIDGGASRAVGVNGSLMIEALTQGNHSVKLDQLAPNCSVSGPNPQSIEVLNTANGFVSGPSPCAACQPGVCA